MKGELHNTVQFACHMVMSNEVLGARSMVLPLAGKSRRSGRSWLQARIVLLPLADKSTRTGERDTGS
jgi:hypothetical protein